MTLDLVISLQLGEANLQTTVLLLITYEKEISLWKDFRDKMFKHKEEWSAPWPQASLQGGELGPCWDLVLNTERHLMKQLDYAKLRK